jgi:poly-gamma-glutamate synthesis protein (capsule biosynthesis protein)
MHQRRDVQPGGVTLFLCGDVMTGRGIDQILAHPGAPEIHEPCVRDARDYVAMAEQTSGPIPRPVGHRYIWGEALDELERVNPAARIINLESSITSDIEHRERKEIHYRMHPLNVPCLTAARIDVCSLANNHVLDYGRAGLQDTLAALAAAGLKTAGAGPDIALAQRPAIVEAPGRGRVIVFSLGTETSGIPPDWAATEARAGVSFLEDLSERSADEFIERVRRVKRGGDVVVASIHWGSNWGYAVPRRHRQFAHRLIDGGVDVLHGHSSHHPRPIEVYREKLVLYGCGDFINDYEGIAGRDEFRDDLVLMYLPRVEWRTGALIELRMVPMRIHKMRLNHASPVEADWLRARLGAICSRFGSRLDMAADRSFRLRWNAAEPPRCPSPPG